MLGNDSSEHIMTVSLVVHPDAPEKGECPGCAKVGLFGHRIPCGARLEALRILAVVQRRRTGAPAKVEPGPRPRASKI